MGAHRAFQRSFESFPTLLSYVDEAIVSVKEKIAWCFTRDLVTMGARTTSRVEGAHFALKCYVDCRRCKLRRFLKRVHDSFCSQSLKYEQKMAIESSTTSSITIEELLLLCVSQKISIYAMENLSKVLEIWRRKDFTDNCRCWSVKCFGLPCVHDIASRSDILSIDMIHPQWHLMVSDAKCNLFSLDCFLIPFQIGGSPANCS